MDYLDVLPYGMPGAIDAIRLSDEDRLADLVTRHPNVVAILCGHAHSPAATTFAGRPLLVVPGVVSTLRMPWSAAAPAGTSTMSYRRRLRSMLDDLGRLTTRYRLTV